ncbi:uncharacterized protein LOC125203317 isoform X1 [Salvia hispanica]|uniref:uncharacterized protein LOC125203317 isoform X1 n=1 Tax=Salvia hispanica TaxID=49212 RepID=UPI0020096445|nr:uncharacterized protein LOC125203317 isoform X1 [Salvia hispanica]XP_047957592.1 uncharacterized protein LOC125203317 isoform X1 [Salvia hispanica]
MRRFHRFCIFLFLTSINFWFLCAGKTSEVCISPGGRFPPFSNVGKPPTKARKGPRDLTLCRVFRKETCCDATQTHPALLSIRRLASSGEASQECLNLWEFLECSICDPRVGVQRGPPNICASFCDRIYEACSTAYFAMDGKTQVLAPCGQGDFVCGRASEWVSNGTELCNAAGFSVKPLDEPGEFPCYGGKGSLDYIANSWKSSRSEIVRGEQNTEVVQDFMQLIVDMPLSERISWAVGGMVLTAGLLFASRRKSNGQRQKQAAIQRTGRRLGTRISPPASPVSHGNRKNVGK